MPSIGSDSVSGVAGAAAVELTRSGGGGIPEGRPGPARGLDHHCGLSPSIHPTMLDLQIPNMTCGHCARAVTEAVKAADPAAKVVIDLPTHKVQIETQAPREAVLARLAEAGYEPAAA